MEFVDPSPTFWGLNTDIWIAAATFAGPALAVLLGLLVFRVQQQSQAASERFVDRGTQALYGALSMLLSIHLQNYQVANYTIRMVKTLDLGGPLAPDEDDIPHFLGLELPSLPIDSLLPVEELVGEGVLTEWVTHVLSDVTLEARECEFQIRQPVAAYYTKRSRNNFARCK